MEKVGWFKNLFFVSLILAGGLTLFGFLMAKQRIIPPESFRPGSEVQTDIENVVATLDAAFRQGQIASGIQPAELVDNLTVARRLGLGLAGTIPSLEEIRMLESLPEDQQVYWWVSRLLEDRRTSNHVAERFARALVGVEDGPFLIFRRSRFVSWLSDQFQNNVRYDNLARRIMTNDGLWTDTPAVNFYTRTITQEEQAKPDPVLLAGRTSRVFLGMRIDCLQCHDDFLGNVNLGSVDNPRGGTQLDFHSLAAFFGQVENSFLGIRDAENSDPYRYRLLNQTEESEIEPAVPFYHELDSGESVLRDRLASWVTHRDNRVFARATVNRVWAILFGQPYLEPVDDIPIDGPFPKPLELLVDDFIAHQYKLHRLIRIIAHSEAFRRSSIHPDAVSGKYIRHGAVFPMNQLRPQQVAGAMIQSTKLTTVDFSAHIVTRLTGFGQQNSFVRRFGDPGEDEFEDKGETVTQRLLMLNGNMVNERVKNGLNSPSHLATVSPDDETTIETVYLSVLSRRPEPEEKEHFAIQLEGKSRGQKSRAVLDLYWTLINSAEFRWSH
ncbi:MAG: DUF1553 domain-containing protein [Planctomycetota bacterium]